MLERDVGCADFGGDNSGAGEDGGIEIGGGDMACGDGEGEGGRNCAGATADVEEARMSGVELDGGKKGEEVGTGVLGSPELVNF